MKTVTIRWQRLINGSGQTCDRCDSTGGFVESAFKKLQKALQGLNIEVKLETKAIDYETFRSDPLLSNQILINDKPLEDWIGGTTGQSRCCDVCGDSECRTVSVGKDTFEAIPEELIIRASLLAAAELLSD
jgi:hypothetical protein